MIEWCLFVVVSPIYYALDCAPWLLVVPLIGAVVVLRRLPRVALVVPVVCFVACAGVVHRRPGGSLWEVSLGGAPTACAEVLAQPGVSAIYTPAQGAPDPHEAKLYDVAWLPERRALLATYWSDAAPRVIDVDTGTAREVTGLEGVGVSEMTATDGRSVYVTANCGMAEKACASGWRFDGDNATPLDVPLQRAAHVAIDTATGRQWWAQDGHRGVAVTGDRTAILPIGPVVWKLDVDVVRRRVFVADFYFGGKVHAIDADTFTEVATRWVAPVLTDVATDSARGRAYVARPLGSAISALDADTLAEVAVMPAPFGVRELDIEPEVGRIAAGSFFAARAVVLDASGATVREIRTGGPVRGVRWMGQGSVVLADSVCGVIRLDVPSVTPAA